MNDIAYHTFPKSVAYLPCAITINSKNEIKICSLVSPIAIIKLRVTI